MLSSGANTSPTDLAPLDSAAALKAATEAQINWLSAFYAVEWTVFCGFSVFLWWRLVRDAQLLEAQTPSQTEG